MATQRWAVILILLMTLVTSAGQIFYKLAAAQFSLSIEGTLLNWPLWVGSILYIISFIMMTISFKGGDISVLYPIIALSYVWVSLISFKVFPADTMNVYKWSGIAVIVGGVSLIGLGSRK